MHVFDSTLSYSFLLFVRFHLLLGFILRFLSAPFFPEPYRSILPFTMIGLRRLRALRRLAMEVNARGIPGDFVECGTCRGGSGALLATLAGGKSEERRTWLLDSFAGLPTPSKKDGIRARAFKGFLKADPKAVKTVLERTHTLKGDVHIVSGWFQDTIPQLPIRSIALLHLDADWYESTLYCLESLYSKVSPGGVIVLDDYNGYWVGCNIAWNEFRNRLAIEAEVERIDSFAIFIRKPLVENGVLN